MQVLVMRRYDWTERGGRTWAALFWAARLVVESGRSFLAAAFFEPGEMSPSSATPSDVGMAV